jgi:hypothetical protein
MNQNCAPACQSCKHVTIEGCCPINPDTTTNAWAEGDLDEMFTKLTNEPYLLTYDDVQILSSPASTGGPWVITIDDLISKTEAQQLINLGDVEGCECSSGGRDLLPEGTYETIIAEGRTSTNAFCTNEKCFQDKMVQLIILHQLGNLPGIAEPNSAYLQLFAL